jgi:hypothetical protein
MYLCVPAYLNIQGSILPNIMPWKIVRTVTWCWSSWVVPEIFLGAIADSNGKGLGCDE